MQTAIPLMGVPVLNRGDLLLRLIGSIDFRVENLIIVNNGRDSSILSALDVLQEGDSEFTRFIDTVTILQPDRNLGVSASFNLIMKSLPETSLYAMVVGSDIQFGSGDLLKMHNAIFDCITNAGSEKVPPIVFGNHGYSYFCLTHETYKMVGSFDENIYPAYLEDCDYSYRVKLAGVNNLYVPETQAVHGEAPHWGSSTIYSDERLFHKNSITHSRNFEYYRRKWGGINGQEVFLFPFNNTAHDHRYWEFDSEWRKGNDIWEH